MSAIQRALHHLLDPLFAIARRHALDFRDERQILGDGHVRVERRRLREVSGAPLGFDRLFEDVEAGDDRLALGGGM